MINKAKKIFAYLCIVRKAGHLDLVASQNWSKMQFILQVIVAGPYHTNEIHLSIMQSHHCLRSRSVARQFENAQYTTFALNDEQ